MAQARVGRQRGVEDAFVGKAAQAAVMSELLQRRCNVAVPEIDLGIDVLAFVDDGEGVSRLQVKACASPYEYTDGSGYSAKFVLPMKQLGHRNSPPLYYVLAVFREDRWTDYLVVPRTRLLAYVNADPAFGSYNRANDAREITVEFRSRVECSGRDLTDCRNAWDNLPPLRVEALPIEE